MSRFYEAEGENPAERLYWPNLRRAVNSIRGQRVMREVAAALLAMPKRKLIAGAIKEPETGDVCAVGAVAQYKGVNLDRTPVSLDDPTLVGWEGDQDETIELGVSMGMGKMIPWHLGFMNDIELPGWDKYEEKRSKERGNPFVWNEEKQCFEYLWFHSCYVELWDERSGRWRLDRVQESIGNWLQARVVTDEQRWQAVYDWVCSQIKWDLPVPASS